MNSAERHRKAYPHARPSTLYMLEQRDRTTAQLRAEIEAKARANKAVKQFWDVIEYQPLARPIDVVVSIAGKIRALARELVS